MKLEEYYCGDCYQDIMENRAIYHAIEYKKDKEEKMIC